MSKPLLKLDWCSHEAAKYAVEHWHYSRTMPKSKLAKIGVWENERYIGTVIFGVGATPNVTRIAGLKQTEMCELVRIALDKHVSPVSRIVAIAIRILHSAFLGLRLIVSYADPMQQHYGGIYQAGNWLYVGESSPDRQIFINGEWVHRRSVGHLGSSSTIDQVWRPTPGKHKYLYPLDDAMRKQIAPLSKPYPKRVPSADSGTSSDQLEGGGATPTGTLSGVTHG